MSEAVLTVERRTTPGAAREHILATRHGAELMVHLLESMTVWDRCTGPQRVLLAEVCAPVVERLLEVGQFGREDLPVLELPAARMDALRSRGLVDDDGRLTGTAVHAYYWQVWRREESSAALKGAT